MYKHHVPSSTSLSDDYLDDDDGNGSAFFNGPSNTQPWQAAQVSAEWSSKRHPLHSTSTLVARNSYMAHLPAEVLINILKHLHTSRDLFNCLRVSRTWCECTVELLWHKPNFPKHGTLDKMARLLARPDQTFNYSYFIRRLNFLTVAPDLRDDIFAFFARCTRLERLTLVNSKCISGGILSRVLPCFPNLVAIDLSGVVDTSNEAIIGLANSAKRLQGINLAGCNKVSNEGIMALARDCPYLRRVKLSGLSQLTDEPVSALARGCPLLLEIDLNHCELITDAAIRDIWVYSTHMREMRLSFCSNLTDAAFPAPLRLDTLPDAPNPFAKVYPRRQEELCPLILSRSFEHLRMLDLTACSRVTDDAIEGIISHAPKIRNLVLSKCSLLTDRSVESICKLGRHLHYLHLGHANRITDRSVRTLARSCTRIRYVDFANCTLLTDMSVFELSALPKLRRVGLVRVNNLTDEAIYSLAERHATLERIHLSYCDQISVMAIHFLLLKLHKLTHLSLTGVPAFRQHELQKFCREAPREFNTAQRQAFCVYSGKGVSQLRAYLTELFDRITEMNGTDDTEYEEDEYDQDVYHEDTPDPETGGEGDEDEDYLAQQMNTNMSIRRGHGPRQATFSPANQPRPHEYVFQRDRANRMTVNPTAIQNPSENVPAINLQSATPRINTQFHTTSMPVASSSRRIQGYTVADLLPIVESPVLPSSDVVPNRNGLVNSSNGAGFFRQYHDGTPMILAPRDTGTLTPDLNFAEIGHGRGAQGASAVSGTGFNRASTSHSIQGMLLENHHPTIFTPPPNMTPAPNAHVSRRPGSGPLWPYHEPMSVDSEPTPSSRELQQASVPSALGGNIRNTEEIQEPAANVGNEEGRGRSVKRSIRDTLNAAEHYANAFLFGRHSTGSRDGRSDSNVASGSRNGPYTR